MISRRRFCQVPLVLAPLLAGCAATAPTITTTIQPPAWLVVDPAPLLAQLTADQDVRRISTSAQIITVAATTPTPVATVSDWMGIALQAIKDEQMTAPPRAARDLAYLAVALHDSLHATDAARARQIAVTDALVLTSAATTILRYCHPVLASRFEQIRALSSDVPDRATSVALGRAVADTLLDHARTDGADVDAPPFEEPNPVAGRWAPTLPDRWQPMLPRWGQVRPLVMDNLRSLAVPPPPAWNSPAFAHDREQFARTQMQLTDADRALAKHWAAGSGTVTPAGMWVETATRLVTRDQLDARSAARVYALLSVAMHAAFIACWEAKFRSMVARPIQWMHEHATTWRPVIVTPPFPSYPSGHAMVSGAGTTVLQHLFPRDRAALEQDARDAAHSRVVGGIHWSLDSQAGLSAGRTIGAAVFAQRGTSAL